MAIRLTASPSAWSSRPFVSGVDDHVAHEPVLRVALSSLRPLDQIRPHAVEDEEAAGAGPEEGGVGRRHGGDVRAPAAVVLPLLGAEVPPRAVAHRVAVDGELVAVQPQGAGHVAELVEVPGDVGADTVAALHPPVARGAHPRRSGRVPVEVEGDRVAISERQAVVLVRREHLDPLPLAKVTSRRSHGSGMRAFVSLT